MKKLEELEIIKHLVWDDVTLLNRYFSRLLQLDDIIIICTGFNLLTLISNFYLSFPYSDDEMTHFQSGCVKIFRTSLFLQACNFVIY